jgi:hypothetical protein
MFNQLAYVTFNISICDALLADEKRRDAAVDFW